VGRRGDDDARGVRSATSSRNDRSITTRRETAGELGRQGYQGYRAPSLTASALNNITYIGQIATMHQASLCTIGSHYFVRLGLHGAVGTRTAYLENVGRSPSLLLPI